MSFVAIIKFRYNDQLHSSFPRSTFDVLMCAQAVWQRQSRRKADFGCLCWQVFEFCVPIKATSVPAGSD
jgi:hypothetical protein